MKKEIKIVDEKKGIVQITTVDERFYAIPEMDKSTGLPIYRYYPSVTYITGFYPKGKFFEEWLKKMGNEAEIVKQLAGEKGSKIHQGIALLLDGIGININSTLINSHGELELLTVEEYEAIYTFSLWFNKIKPVIKSKDIVILNQDVGYAGTLDLECEINKVPYIIDFKTSQNIWPSFELQLSAYKHTPEKENHKLAILQLGYARNKEGYKFTEFEDKFDLFKAVYQIFSNETKDKQPKQIELPLEIKIGGKL